METLAPTVPCVSCGSPVIRADDDGTALECIACRPPEPVHETVRLFTPAPNVIPGQLGL